MGKEAAAEVRRENALASAYRQVRAQSERICKPLTIEDHGIQTIVEASPPKWHLAHVTWFFETFVLAPFSPGYRLFDPRFGGLFNSYYDSVGSQWPRPRRGELARPTVEEVQSWRAHVDAAVVSLLETNSDPEIVGRVELGLAHEQQHQELLLTDIKQNFSANPLYPVYRDLPIAPEPAAPASSAWINFDGGMVEIGNGGKGFAFDNERPRHKLWLEPYRLASQPVTNAEYLAFIEAGGYREPELWLSDGWATVRRENWQAPLHWRRLDGKWFEFTLGGLRPLQSGQPVCHVSYYEADAFARWAGRRLPIEAEWEHAAAGEPASGNLQESGWLQPVPAARPCGLGQLYGDVWEWTASPYVAYPGYRRADGAFGEYNGKFMCNQWVVRGGSCLTPADHIRATYRNFFYPHDRWQVLGVRLADGSA